MNRARDKINSPNWRGGSLALLFSILCLAGALNAQTAEVCADCHEEAETFPFTPHGALLGNAHKEIGGQSICASCHGEVAAHIKEGDPDLILNPANRTERDADALCLSCHNGDRMHEWDFSAHKLADVSCADCHTLHRSVLNTEESPTETLCLNCHSELKAALRMPSHHPVSEGKVDCVDCHNPHGADLTFADGPGSKELCYGCHAEKEGPFVYEHAPVAEDCMLCHTPHGSVADNLLKQNEPTLCLNCHSMHFHATLTGVDGQFAPLANPERVTVSTPDGWKRGMLTKCTQCHSAVHGSDLPSQAISNGGTGLTR